MRKFHWWTCQACGATYPRTVQEEPKRCPKCLSASAQDYKGHKPIEEEVMKEQPPPVAPAKKREPVKAPDFMEVEVEVHNGKISDNNGVQFKTKNYKGLPELGLAVHIFDFDARKELHNDEVEGRSCRHRVKTNGPGVDNEKAPFQVFVYLDKGQVSRVAVLKCVCFVKTFKGKSEPTVKKWSLPAA